MDYALNNMQPSISDHALLYLKRNDDKKRKMTNFKFFKSTADMAYFLDTINKSWKENINGRHIYVLWKKLQRLQLILQKMSKPLSDVNLKISQARHNLFQAQVNLENDIMNPNKVN